MKAGKQTRREAKDLFRATVVNGIMDDTRVRAVVREVLEKKPRGFIAILEHFKRLVKLEQDRRAARVESAVALTPEQQSGVSSNLQRIYGQGLNITFTQNPALIGGLRVRVGSDVYDGSVAARLQNIEENFA
jgi:F-type H+-transporting ATPase subunit delta